MNKNIALLLTAITCPPTKIINKTTIWTQNDKDAIVSIAQGCLRQYDDSPCLKILVKSDEGVYSAICGKPDRSK